MSAQHDITIHIDQKRYDAPKSPMTGTEIRALAQPPLGPDRDLWLVVPGPSDDERIADGQAVELKNGMHFYSAPTTINPGAPDAPA